MMAKHLTKRQFKHMVKVTVNNINLNNINLNNLFHHHHHHHRYHQQQQSVNSSTYSAVEQQQTTNRIEQQCPFRNKNNLNLGTSTTGTIQQLNNSMNNTTTRLSIDESYGQEKQLMPYESIPKPKGHFIFGTLFDLMKSGGAEYVHKYCDSRHRELGPIYREKMGNQEIVFIADANLMQRVYQFEGKYPQHMVPEPWIIFNELKGVQRGLFFMDGEEWSERRKCLNKLLLMPSTINQYCDVFNQVITDLINRWDSMVTRSSDGHETTVEHLEKELYNWSIESLGTMIFGRRLGCVSQLDNNHDKQSGQYNNTDDNQIHDFVHWVQQIFIESAKMTMVPPRLAYRLNLPVWRRFVTAAENALSLARNYVEENFNGLKNDNNDKNKSTIKEGIINQMFDGNKIDQEEIVRIIIDLFIAAADTTSHATQWAFYLLARHPQCQQQLLKEVNDVTGGQQLQECHLANLPYVKGVIKEALRLYPVAPFLTRYLSRNLDLGGYHIPSGKLIAMSLYTTGRMGQYFDSPDQFRPERWLRDKETGKHEVTNSHACLPFGLGVRSCIGRRVAEIQMQFLLSRIVQTFDLKPASPNEIGIKLRMITTPEQPIRLVIKKRI